MWQLEHGIAHLRLARVSAMLSPALPFKGLHDLRVDGHQLANARLLGVDLPGKAPMAESVEQYVRGGDLVATFHETPVRPLRAQAYWRVVSGADGGTLAAIELIASVQTSLLDACPRLMTRSALGAGDALRLADAESGTFLPLELQKAPSISDVQSDSPRCFLFRPEGAAFSYAEMATSFEVEATELNLAPPSEPSGFRLAHRLFAERLEKGVILRARVLGVLVDRQGDASAACEHYRTLLSTPPPLTT